MARLDRNADPYGGRGGCVALQCGVPQVLRLPDTDMPIVDIEVVTDTMDRKSAGKEVSQRLAEALGFLFASEPGGTWVRLRSIDRTRYAENRTTTGSDARPTFVHILRAELPEPAALRREMMAVAEVVARTLDRPRENVHVLYAPDGRGRIGFGGTLLE